MGVPTDPAAAAGLLTPEEVVRAADEQSGRRWSRTSPSAPSSPTASGPRSSTASSNHSWPASTPVTPGRLSLQATVPALWAAATDGTAIVGQPRNRRPGGPVFAGYRGGLGPLASDLAAAVAGRGGEIRTRSTVRELARRPDGWRLTVGPTIDSEALDVDGVVLALPADPGRPPAAPRFSSAAAELDEIDYASVAIVTLALPRSAAVLLGGSGFLVPPVEPLAIKAATFSSTKWAWLAEDAQDVVLLRASLGRAGEVAVLQRDDADLVEHRRRRLEDGPRTDLPDPVDGHVQRWGGALPQYAVGHVTAYRPSSRRSPTCRHSDWPAPPTRASAYRRASGRGAGQPARCSPPCASHNEGMSDRPTRKPAPSVVREINDSIRYAMWSVFASVQPLGEDREKVAAEAAALLTDVATEGVVVRGLYDVAGLRADADLMIWWHAETIEQLQSAYHRFLRTELGAALEPVWSVAALHRPAEFNKSHVPAFLAGEDPKAYICVYPFVRSYDWYLLDDARVATCSWSTASWRAGTRTSGPTPSRRSRWATTSGSSRSRPTSCTGSSTSCVTCGPRRRGGTSARRSPSTPAPGCRSRTSSRTCADYRSERSCSRSSRSGASAGTDLGSRRRLIELMQ